MNQQIRELADEAAKYSAVMALPTGQSGNELFVEKFAELIVRECVKVCKAQSTYDPIVLPYKPSEQFEKAILEHFGVES